MPRRRTAHSTAGYGEVGGALSPATRAWGWIEGDLVAQWRLRTPELGIDLKSIVNGRVGSAFRLTRFMKLGVGVFTNRSPIDRIRVTRVATTDIDFYGVHLGFLF